jgi:long-chain acyl-CoA synthetase
MNELLTVDQIIAALPPSKTAIVDATGSLTFGELDSLVSATAGGLVARIGTGQSRVVVLARTERDGVIGLLGAHRAGFSACLLDPRQTALEHAGWIDLAKPDVILVGRESVDSVAALGDVEPAILGVAGSDIDVELCVGDPIPPAERSKTAPAVAVATSGVTGNPHLVDLSHGTIAAIQIGLLEAHDGQISDSSVLLAVLPIAHILGLNSGVLGHLRAGATVVLMSRFEETKAADLVEEHGVTSLIAVPPMWQRWVDLDIPAEKFASVVVGRSGASSLHPSLAVAVHERLGVDLMQGYGLSETAGTICIEPNAKGRPGSVGKPIPGVELRLVEGGEEVEPGDRGEVWIRGPVMDGYIGDAAASEQVLAGDGWFRSGDVGVLDEDGSLYLLGRIKDLIIVSGFNVYPAEVEHALETHPSIANALVVGEQDAASGERIVAYVTSIEGARVTVDEIAAHCRGRLSRYKHPKDVYVVDRLPIIESGKRVRAAVR